MANDPMLFARVCFSEHLRDELSEMHREWIADLARDRTSERIAEAAPRGHGKSTLGVLIASLWRIVTRRTRFLVIVSATIGQAEDRVKEIAQELRENASLRAIYGELLDPRTASTDWRTRTGIRVKAAARGSNIRGWKSGPWRPTDVELDDVERDEESPSPLRRARDRHWLATVVLPLGEAGTSIRVRGTLIGRDSLLGHLLSSPGWDGRRWSAIPRWPDRTDLWEQCREIWADLERGSLEDRNAAALDYYAEHQVEMDAGAEVLWSARAGEDLFGLHVQLWTMGARAFASEKRNEPLGSEHRPFAIERLHWFRTGHDEQGRPGVEVLGPCRRPDWRPSEARRFVLARELSLTLYWDQARGRSMGSDYGALAVVGRDRLGQRYVLQSWLARVPTSEQARAGWRLIDAWWGWGLREWCLESVAFSAEVRHLIETERTRRRDAGEHWQVGIVEMGVGGRSNEDRIGDLEPAVANGWVLFSEAMPQETLDQLADFPAGAHDDGPLSIAGACERLGAPTSRSATPSPIVPDRGRDYWEQEAEPW